MKIFLDTIGCRLNQAEIERYAVQFTRMGHELVPDAESGKLAIFTEGANSAFESQFEYGLFDNGAFSVKHLLEFNSENASPWTLAGQPCEAAAAEALLAGWQSANLDPMLMPFSSLATEKDE